MSDSNGEESSLVVDKLDYTGTFIKGAKEHAPACILIFVLILILYIATYHKDTLDSFTSPDGVVARRSQSQIRDDPEIDKDWNQKEMENAVSALNKVA